ncbi:MAG: hypothetical protein RIC87_00625 [Kiloniellales bacterium]
MNLKPVLTTLLFVPSLLLVTQARAEESLPQAFRDCPAATRLLEGAEPDLPCLLRVVSALSAQQLALRPLLSTLQNQTRLSPRNDALATLDAVFDRSRLPVTFNPEHNMFEPKDLSLSDQVLSRLFAQNGNIGLIAIPSAVALRQDEMANKFLNYLVGILSAYGTIKTDFSNNTFSNVDIISDSRFNQDFLYDYMYRIVRAFGELGRSDEAETIIKAAGSETRGELYANLAIGLANRAYLVPESSQLLMIKSVELLHKSTINMPDQAYTMNSFRIDPDPIVAMLVVLGKRNEILEISNFFRPKNQTYEVANVFKHPLYAGALFLYAGETELKISKNLLDLALSQANQSTSVSYITRVSAAAAILGLDNSSLTLLDSAINKTLARFKELVNKSKTVYSHYISYLPSLTKRLQARGMDREMIEIAEILASMKIENRLSPSLRKDLDDLFIGAILAIIRENTPLTPILFDKASSAANHFSTKSIPILVALTLAGREEVAYQLASRVGSQSDEARRLIGLASKSLTVTTIAGTETTLPSVNPRDLAVLSIAFHIIGETDQANILAKQANELLASSRSKRRDQKSVYRLYAAWNAYPAMFDMIARLPESGDARELFSALGARHASLSKGIAFLPVPIMDDLNIAMAQCLDAADRGLPQPERTAIGLPICGALAAVD